MKSYPSISKNIINYIYIYAFDKLDGSNIRAEWNLKKGFYKFGTRTQLIDEKSVPFGNVIPLIKDKFESDLNKAFKEQGWKDVICFFEYWGENSFAGNHDFNQEMNLTLIDVNPFKQGILPPEQFIKLFGHLNIPNVCYKGYVSTEFIDQVKLGTLKGMTQEGVVCKGENDKKTKMPIMFKIKSNIWLEKLKEYCKDNKSLFERLS